VRPLGERLERLSTLARRREHVGGGQEAIPGARPVGTDDVARLLAAECCALSLHRLPDLAVADRATDRRDPFPLERALEAEV
jgi:hypothetical protein